MKKIVTFSQFKPNFDNIDSLNEKDSRYELYVYLEDSIKKFVSKNIFTKVEYSNTKNKINSLYDHIMIEMGSLFKSFSNNVKIDLDLNRNEITQVNTDSELIKDEDLVNFDKLEIKTEDRWNEIYEHIKKRNELYKKSHLNTIKPSTWGLGNNANTALLTSQITTNQDNNKNQASTTKDQNQEELGFSKSAHKEIELNDFFNVSNFKQEYR